MTDLDNLRRMAKERAEFDPLAAMAMDGCADEIEDLRAEVKLLKGLISNFKTALRNL